jgi:hypothetical protein
MAGAKRFGPGETGHWFSWNNLGPREIVVPSWDADQVWISGGAIEGGNELHRVDAIFQDVQPRIPGTTARAGDLVYSHERFTGEWLAGGALGRPDPPTGPGPGVIIPAGRVFNGPDNPSGFLLVSVASVRDELHVCAIGWNRRLYHVYRQKTDPFHNNWSQWTDIEFRAGERGRFIEVGCAGVYNPATGMQDLHLCGVTGDGHIWHAVGSGTLSNLGFSNWSPLADVGGVIGERGNFFDVDCAGNRGQLHLVALTASPEEGDADRRVWHTIRNPGGGWAPPTDVLAAAGIPADARPFTPSGVAIGFCNAGVRPGPSDFSQLNVAISGRTETPAPSIGRVIYTIRSTNSIEWRPGSSPSLWKPAIDLLAETHAPTPRSVGVRSVAERPFPG